MISVDNIQFGWLTLSIEYNLIKMYFGVGEDNAYDNDKSEIISRSINLDGEGTDLKLTLIKHRFEDNACLVWWQDYEMPVPMVFNYQDLVNNWIDVREKTREQYDKDFIYNEVE